MESDCSYEQIPDGEVHGSVKEQVHSFVSQIENNNGSVRRISGSPIPKTKKHRDFVRSFKEIHVNQKTQIDESIWQCAGNNSAILLEFEENCYPYIEEVDSENSHCVIEEAVNVYLEDSKKGKQQWTLRFEITELVLYFDPDPESRIQLDWENVLGATCYPIKRCGYGAFELSIALMKIEQATCLIPLNRQESSLKFTLEKENRAQFLVTLVQNFARTCNYMKIISNELAATKILTFKHSLLVIILNKKQFIQTWLSVQSMFSTAGYDVKIHYVFAIEEAVSYCKDLSKSKLMGIRGILAVSGDDLLNQIIQGIMSRYDCSEVLSRIVVSALDGGIVSSVLADCGEPITHHAAAYLVCKGKIRSVDLIEVQTADRQVMYAANSIAYGYYSNQSLSFFSRFSQLTRQKKYPCRLLVTDSQLEELPEIGSPLRGSSNKAIVAQTDQNSWREIEEKSFKFVNIMNSNRFNANSVNAPNKTLSDGYIDLQYLTGDKPWRQLLAYNSAAPKGEHFNGNTKEPVQNMLFGYHKIKGFRMENIDGNISIDSISYPGINSIQGRILQNQLRVFTL